MHETASQVSDSVVSFQLFTHNKFMKITVCALAETYRRSDKR